MTTTYHIDHAALTVIVDSGSAGRHDLNQGEPCRTVDELRDFVREAHRQGAYDAETRDALLDDLVATCECACGCTAPATTTDDSSTPVCYACADYYVDADGQPVCSREQGEGTCRHCGSVIEWGTIQVASRGGASRFRQGRCSCRQWRQEEYGRDWRLVEVEP